MKRFFFFLILGLFLLAGFSSALSFVINELKGSIPKIFDLEKDSSWVIEKRIWGDRTKFLTQRDGVPRAESFILSKDSWKDVDLVMLVQNPHSCGVIFNYRDNNNYDYFFYDSNKERLIAVTIQNSEQTVRKIMPLRMGPLWVLKLKIDSREAKVYDNTRLLASMEHGASFGKIGLIAAEIVSPNIQFYQFNIRGQTPRGLEVFDNLKHEHQTKPAAIVLLYVILLGIFTWLKLLLNLFRGKETAHQSWADVIFDVFAVGIGAFVFIQWVNTWGRLELSQFQNVFLWHCLAVSLLSYGLIYLLALSYHKLFRLLSTPVLLIGLPFLLYVLALVNLVTFKIDDRLFLWLCLLILYLPAVYAAVRQRVKPRWSHIKDYQWSWMDLLIFLWVMHGLFYCMESNFDINRGPMADENHFWFIGAENILKGNLLQAHLFSYPSGIVHSLAIPFIWALPGKLFGVVSSEVIYFAPLLVIMALLTFWDILRADRWCFLFLYVALYDLFNNHGSWITLLFYSLLYGEAVSTIFFLCIVYEIRKVLAAQTLTIKDIFATALVIGLLSLGKVPVSYLSPVLAGIFFIFVFPKINSRKGGALTLRRRPNPILNGGVQGAAQSNNPEQAPLFRAGRVEGLILFLSFLVFLSPVFVWKLFSVLTEINNNPLVLGFKQIHLTQEGWIMAVKVWAYIKLSYAGIFVYMAATSAIFIVMTFRGKELLLTAPIVILTIGLFIYYGLIYTAGDEFSSIRYLLPVVPALFYLGAVGFSRWIQKLKRFSG